MDDLYVHWLAFLVRLNITRGESKPVAFVDASLQLNLVLHPDLPRVGESEGRRLSGCS